MAIRSGLGGQVGIAKETTYGTFVAPTRWLEVNKSDMRKVKNTVQGGGLAAGRMMQPGSRRVVTTHAASGSPEMEVVNKGMGPLLENLMGTTVTPVQQAATTAYLQTHTLADPYGKSLTIQNGIPQLSDGVVKPYNFVGSKVLSAEFACGVDELLVATFEVDSREAQETDVLAAPSYPSAVAPFHFTQMEVKVGATAGAAAHVDGVRKVTCRVDRASRTDRFYAGNLGRKLEPPLNGFTAITGSFDVDYITKADFADRFAADTGFALVWEFVGPTIASTFKETFRVTLPQCFLDGDTPSLDGPDIITGPFPFVSQYDGTTQPFIEYMSSDSIL